MDTSKRLEELDAKIADLHKFVTEMIDVPTLTEQGKGYDRAMNDVLHILISDPE